MANLSKIKAENNMAKEVEKVIADIEKEDMRNLNDSVLISEDGYVHDEPLLAGYVDEDGVRHMTFTYREMTGKDEEAINKADVRSNGAKLVNVLVERCVVEIGTIKKKEVGGAKWGQIIRSMLGGDLDYMVFKIRELSKGNEITFTHVCPNCGTKLDTVVDTSEFSIKPFNGLFEVPFTLNRGYKNKDGELHTEGILRVPNGMDREVVTPLYKKNPSTAITMLISRVISFNDGAYVMSSYVNEMGLRDRKVLEDILNDCVFGIDTSLDIECSNCGQNLSGEVGQSDFF